MGEFETLGLKRIQGRLLVLDQTRLPHEEVWIECREPGDMIECIRQLRVRGAPLIGVAAACALAKFAENHPSLEGFEAAASALRQSRPTAVNLMAAVDRVLAAQRTSVAVQRVAREILDEDIALCDRMAAHGAALIQAGEGILTHCNTGGLATAGSGTALSVIRRAHELGRRIHVYVDETRPLLQGARLTTWELGRLGIPFTLICDNMAAALMRTGRVNRVLLGADRIAANGDFANKVGTYGVAVAARHHGIPFHVVAPHTTVDLGCPNGAAIPIEERAPGEVRSTWSPSDCRVWNPAFDVTPAALVTSWVLDTGVYTQPGFS